MHITSYFTFLLYSKKIALIELMIGFEHFIHLIFSHFIASFSPSFFLPIYLSALILVNTQIHSGNKVASPCRANAAVCYSQENCWCLASVCLYFSILS